MAFENRAKGRVGTPHTQALALVVSLCVNLGVQADVPTRETTIVDAGIADYSEAEWSADSPVTVAGKGTWQVTARTGAYVGIETTEAVSGSDLVFHLLPDETVSFVPEATSLLDHQKGTSEMALTAYESGQLPTFSTLPRGAIAVETLADGSFAFKGYAADGWVTLTGPGISASDDMTATVAIETFVCAGEMRVRYTVNGVTMRDGTGRQWLRSAQMPSAAAPEYAYLGNGSVYSLVVTGVDPTRALALVGGDGAIAYYAAGARTTAEAALESARTAGDADAALYYLNDAFRVTPYLQHPATNAMSVLWFTETNQCAAIRWWPLSGGEVAYAETSPECAAELAYSDTDRAGYTSRTGYSGIERGPIQTLPWQHRVRLTNLVSGVTYRYAVTLESGLAYTNTFHTAPSRDTPIRFLCYSDCETEPESTGKYESSDIPPGSARTNKTYPVDQTVGYAENIVRMKERNPDFYVLAGDLVQYGYEQRDWDEFWRHNAGVRNDPAGSVPILASPGNHDYVSSTINSDNRAAYDGGESAIQRYLRYFEFEPNGVPSASFENTKDRSELFHRLDYGRATVLFIDTNNGDDSDPTRDSCTVLYRNAAAVPAEYAPTANQSPCRAPDFNPGSPQFTWLTNQLADAQAKGQFIFVVNHHMPYSVGYHNRPNTWRANSYSSGDYEPYSARAVRVLTPYFLRYGVTAWIAGHDEIMEHSQVKGTEILPNGRSRSVTLNIYDVGNSGDGLRGGGDGVKQAYFAGEANRYEVFRAHVDAPEIFENGVWTDGGKHYGHLEVNIAPNEKGVWMCTIQPMYVFVNAATGPFDRRAFHDGSSRRNPFDRGKVPAIYLR